MASIMQEVDELKHELEEEPVLKQESLRLGGILIAGVIYAVGINLFLRPLELYSGGFMGFAQLLDTLLREHLGLSLGGRNIAGIIYYAFNVPGLIFAFRLMRRRFVIKSILTVTCFTLLLTLIPIPAEPILEETIANCLVAGILSGIGVGLSLRMGACDGGVDLIGMILIQTKGRFSIGMVNIMCNIVLYGICLMLFDVRTVIYSMIYSVIVSVTTDRVHTQNINVQALIVTKMQDIEALEVELMGKMNRGLTRWTAYGGYTGQEETVLMTIISKYEIAELKTIVHQVDPKAFVMLDEGVGVDGHFLKKLT